MFPELGLVIPVHKENRYIACERPDHTDRLFMRPRLPDDHVARKETEIRLQFPARFKQKRVVRSVLRIMEITKKQRADGLLQLS